MRIAVLFVSLVGVVLSSSVATAGPILWVNDAAGNLGKVDVATGHVELLGNSGVVLTDIGFDSAGNLFGVSFTTFYSVNKSNGAATPIGSLGTFDANALVFASDGTAYTMGFGSDDLYTINVATGGATVIGDVSGFRSGGDLAFHNNALYLATTTNSLVRVELGTVSGTLVGPFSVSNVFGLANGDDNVLYAVAGTSVYSVNALTGAATFVVDYGGQGLGAANGEAFIMEARTVVPEPASVALALVGFAGFGLFARRATKEHV